MSKSSIALGLFTTEEEATPTELLDEEETNIVGYIKNETPLGIEIIGKIERKKMDKYFQHIVKFDSPLVEGDLEDHRMYFTPAKNKFYTVQNQIMRLTKDGIQ